MWEIICYNVVGISILFLWITSLSGTKYYEISTQLRDIKFLKSLIHIITLSSIMALAYIIWMSNNV